uniref:Uncharacterized protein n=1 Tax=Phocoena sinus TaxID=42100 RepID=A0A8C9DYT6_PHOSS
MQHHVLKIVNNDSFKYKRCLLDKHYNWECNLVQPLWKTVWRFLRKLKIELPYDPAIPLLGIYPDKTIIPKGTCTLMFPAALFTIAKTWKPPKLNLSTKQKQTHT